MKQAWKTNGVCFAIRGKMWYLILHKPTKKPNMHLCLQWKKLGVLLRLHRAEKKQIEFFANKSAVICTHTRKIIHAFKLWSILKGRRQIEWEPSKASMPHHRQTMAACFVLLPFATLSLALYLLSAKRKKWKLKSAENPSRCIHKHTIHQMLVWRAGRNMLLLLQTRWISICCRQRWRRWMHGTTLEVVLS